MITHQAGRTAALAFSVFACIALPAHAAGLFGFGGTKSAEKVGPYDFAAGPAPQSGQYVELVRGSNIRDVKKVGIVNFSIEFALYKSASAVGSGTGSGSRAVSLEKQIPPPEVAALQAITDRLYQKVQEDFKAMGVEVVPFETLKATRNFAELAPAQHASPWVTDTKDSQSVFIAPTGMPLYMDNPERADFLKGVGMSFGTNTRMKEVMMTYDLKQEVHLDSVNMVVDFATVMSSGNSISPYGVKVSSSDVHHLHSGNTSYRFVSTTQPEFLYAKLKLPLVSEKDLWAEVSQATEKKSEVQAGGVVGVKTTTDTGSFDSATYLGRSEEMLNAAREMFAAELRKARQ